MRSLAFSACALALFVVGCASKHEEGVKSDYMTQWTMVAADTKVTSAAAKNVLESREFKEVMASSTTEDGYATAKMADGTKVKVDIKRKDAGSEVSVTVGTIGDPKLGADLAKQIKMKAEGT